MNMTSLRLGGAVLAVGCLLAGTATAAPQLSGAACGTNPPAYTAQRNIQTPGGTLSVQVFASGGKEREEMSPQNFTITDTRAGRIHIVDLKAKTVAVRPMPRGAATSKDAVRQGSYVDKKGLGGGLTMVEAGVVVNGKKDWFARTTCRSDGIFTERQMKVPDPKGAYTIRVRQTNIKVGGVGSDKFQIPGGLKTVK